MPTHWSVGRRGIHGQNREQTPDAGFISFYKTLSVKSKCAVWVYSIRRAHLLLYRPTLNSSWPSTLLGPYAGPAHYAEPRITPTATRKGTRSTRHARSSGQLPRPLSTTRFLPAACAPPRPDTAPYESGGRERRPSPSLFNGCSVRRPTPSSPPAAVFKPNRSAANTYSHTNPILFERLALMRWSTAPCTASGASLAERQDMVDRWCMMQRATHVHKGDCLALIARSVVFVRQCVM